MKLAFFIREMHFTGSAALESPSVIVRIVPENLAEEDRGLTFIDLSLRLTSVPTPATADAIADRALQEARALLNESQTADYLQRRLLEAKARIQQP